MLTSTHRNGRNSGAYDKNDPLKKVTVRGKNPLGE